MRVRQNIVAATTAIDDEDFISALFHANQAHRRTRGSTRRKISRPFSSTPAVAPSTFHDLKASATDALLVGDYERAIRHIQQLIAMTRPRRTA